MPTLAAASSIVHTDKVITSEAKPSQAVRQGKGSSMQLAIDSVRQGNAAGIVSAGNTGALMAMSKLALRMLPGIDRPAIAGLFPTLRNELVMLDLGANVDCDAENLIQFAVMGGIFSRAVLGVLNPKVGLLNVGTENVKGNSAVRDAATILSDTSYPISFHGFVEGDDIGKGTVDVVVADGFSGNIALKTLEGTVRLYSDYLRNAFKSSLASRLGYVLARRGLNKLRARLDPRRYNGAMFVGLNGIVVKSHGGTDAFGFANAIGVAIDMASNQLNDKIIEELANHGSGGTVKERAAAS
jgi:glycerol-3-phosphate acyltransferase PlsX